jgi:hypothetical protein
MQAKATTKDIVAAVRESIEQQKGLYQ